ncbi:unnamed protein product [Calypogeia fissa]
MKNNRSGEGSSGENDVTVHANANKRSRVEDLDEKLLPELPNETSSPKSKRSRFEEELNELLLPRPPNEITVQTTKRSRYEEQLNELLVPWPPNEITVEKVNIAPKLSRSKRARFEDLKEQLFPGLPNHITLENIAPKLSWRVFHTLSSVSRSWKQAFESHQVHDARVSSHSTETLVVLQHRPSWDREATAELFSTKDDSCYQLPPIPDVDILTGRGRGHWISLGTKIYAVGAVRNALKKNSMVASTEVYVLDFAGPREWKQCASMQEERNEFGCGVIDGKIYVFGGTLDGYPVSGSEVYDPNEDNWSPITPMTSWRFRHQVATIGKQLVVYGGMFYDPLFLDGYEYPILEPGTIVAEPIYDAAFLEIYHPVKDEWRLVEPFERPINLTKIFVAQGKLHRITSDGIDVHDMDQNVWTSLHTNPFVSIEELACADLVQVSILVANGELLLFAYWMTYDFEALQCGHCLLQSRGFGSQKKEILWERATCPLSLDSRDPFICSIQL